ncbi:hypothetical protein HDE_01522 [Halotydeus destructor]|nr:hypothetical protein HDE_01522 [Halotydeus destructor]
MYDIRSYRDGRVDMYDPMTLERNHTGPHYYSSIHNYCLLKAQQVQNLTRERLEKLFKDKGFKAPAFRRRPKRGWPIALFYALLALISGGVSIASAGYSFTQTEKIAKQLTAMEESVDKQRLAALASAGELLGFSKRTQRSLLAIAVQLQTLGTYDVLRKDQLMKTFQEVRLISSVDLLAAAFINHQFELNQLMDCGSEIVRETERDLNNWISGIASLRHHLLPKQLVDVGALTSILELVDTHLVGTGYRRKFADPLSYYNRKFAHHALLDDNMYIRLIIPLTTIGQSNNPVSIFMPEYYPIPFANEMDNPFQKIFGRLSEMPNLWVYNPDTKEVMVTETQLGMDRRR